MSGTDALVFTQVNVALRKRLLTTTGFPVIATVPQVEDENAVFTPPGTGLWVRWRFLPSEPGTTSLGSNRLTTLSGAFVCTTYGRRGLGSGEVAAFTDALASHFPRGQQLTEEETIVTVVQTGRGPGLHDDNWYYVPVTIRWRSRTLML